MKQKLKQIITSIALCSLIILSGCTQEKEFVNEHNHPKIDFKEKSFKEALSLPLFNDALKKVAKQKGALRSEDAARTALEDQYGFTIVTDAPIRIITDENGTVFYTILIEREVKEELVFENLMIKVEDEETAAAIFKYTMQEKATVNDVGETVVMDLVDTEHTDLNIEGKMFFNSAGETCFSVNIVRCSYSDDRPAGHIATADCYDFGSHNSVANLYNETEISCIGGSGIGMTGGTGGTGGGDAGGPSSNNTGGVGASGGTPDPVVVSPIPCRTGNCMEADVPVDPCEILGEILDTQKINLEGILPSYINSAQNRDKGEIGATFRRTVSSNGTITFPPKIHKDGGNSSVILDPGLDVFGGIHVHPNTLLPMFSFPDIMYLLKFYRQASEENKKRITFMLVASDGNIYAIQLNDYDKYLQFVYDEFNHENNDLDLTQKEKYLKATNRCNDFVKKGGNSPENLQKNFAKYIKNSGIDFFKLEGYPRVWKKIESIGDGNSAPQETTPCN